MRLTQLGRRYERLLFLSGPLTLAGFLLALVSFAASNQRDQSPLRCYTAMAKLLAENGDIYADWQKNPPDPKQPSWNSAYNERLHRESIYLDPPGACYGALRDPIDRFSKDEPEKMSKELRNLADAILSQPLQISGIELPDKASVNLMGTVVKFSLLTFVQMLQIAIAPLLVIWIFSVAGTRFNETMRIAKTQDPADLFPHAVNIYKLHPEKSRRKRSFLAYWLPHSDVVFLALMRALLVTIVIAPPICSYIASLWYSQPFEIVWLSVLMGFLVGIFSIASVAIELMPYHAKKTFESVDLEW